MTYILITDDHDGSGPGSVRSWAISPGGVAEDGRQAVALAAETQPDVAILDYQLPLLNGVDAHARSAPSSREPRC